MQLLQNSRKSGYGLGAIVLFSGLAMAATPGTCAAGKPTAESYKWNFRREAAGILGDFKSDAIQTQNRAAELQSDQRAQLSWQSQSHELRDLANDVNSMGAKLCRLQQIRRMLAPDQRAEINRIDPLVQLMALRLHGAMQYLADNQDRLWSPTYETEVDALNMQATKLEQVVSNFSDLAKVRSEDGRLEKALSLKRGA